MNILLGFFLAIVVPGWCSYGIYLDFDSVSTGILSFYFTSQVLLLLGNQFNVLNKIIDLIKLRGK